MAKFLSVKITYVACNFQMMCIFYALDVWFDLVMVTVLHIPTSTVEDWCVPLASSTLQFLFNCEP